VSRTSIAFLFFFFLETNAGEAGSYSPPKPTDGQLLLLQHQRTKDEEYIRTHFLNSFPFTGFSSAGSTKQKVNKNMKRVKSHHAISKIHGPKVTRTNANWEIKEDYFQQLSSNESYSESTKDDRYVNLLLDSPSENNCHNQIFSTMNFSVNESNSSQDDNNDHRYFIKK